MLSPWISDSSSEESEGEASREQGPRGKNRIRDKLCKAETELRRLRQNGRGGSHSSRLLAKERTSLQSKLEQMRASLAKKDDELDDLHRAHDKLQRMNNQLTLENAKLKSWRSNVVEEKEQEAEHLLKKLELSQQQLAVSRAESETLEAKLAKLSFSVKLEKDRYIDEVRTLSEELETCKAGAKLLQEQLSRENSATSQMEEQLQSKEEELHILEKSKAEQGYELMIARQDLDAKDGEITHLQETVSELRAENQSLYVRVEELALRSAQVEASENACSGLARELTITKAHLQAALEEKSSLEQLVRNLQEDRTKALASFQKELIAANTKVLSLSRDLRNNQMEIETEKAEKDRLARRNVCLESEKEQLERDLETKLDASQQQCISLNETASKMERQLQEQIQVSEKLEEHNSQLATRNKELESRLRETSKALAAAERDSEHTQKQVDVLLQEQTHAERRHRTLENKVAVLEHEQERSLAQRRQGAYALLYYSNLVRTYRKNFSLLSKYAAKELAVCHNKLYASESAREAFQKRLDLLEQDTSRSLHDLQSRLTEQESQNVQLEQQVKDLTRQVTSSHEKKAVWQKERGQLKRQVQDLQDREAALLLQVHELREWKEKSRTLHFEHAQSLVEDRAVEIETSLQNHFMQALQTAEERVLDAVQESQATKEENHSLQKRITDLSKELMQREIHASSQQQTMLKEIQLWKRKCVAASLAQRLALLNKQDMKKQQELNAMEGEQRAIKKTVQENLLRTFSERSLREAAKREAMLEEEIVQARRQALHGSIQSHFLEAQRKQSVQALEALKTKTCVETCAAIALEKAKSSAKASQIRFIYHLEAMRLQRKLSGLVKRQQARSRVLCRGLGEMALRWLATHGLRKKADKHAESLHMQVKAQGIVLEGHLVSLFVALHQKRQLQVHVELLRRLHSENIKCPPTSKRAEKKDDEEDDNESFLSLSSSTTCEACHAQHELALEAVRKCELLEEELQLERAAKARLYTSLQTEVKKNGATLDELCTLESKHRDLESKYLAREERVVSLENQVQAQQETISRLGVERKHESSHRKELDAQLGVTKSLTDSLQQQSQRLSADVKQARQELETALFALQGSQQLARARLTQIKNLEEKIRSLLYQQQYMEQVVTDSKKALLESEAKSANEKENLRSRVKELEHQIDEQGERLQGERASLREVEEEKYRLESRLQDLEASRQDIVLLRERLSNLESDNSTLRVSLESTRRKLVNAQAASKQAEQAKEHIQQLSEDLEKRLVMLKGEVDTSRQRYAEQGLELERLKELLSREQTARKELESQIFFLEETAAEKNAQMSELARANEKGRLDLLEFKSQNEQLYVALEGKLSELSSLKTELHNLEEQLAHKDEFERRCMHLQKELLQTKEHVACLEKDVARETSFSANIQQNLQLVTLRLLESKALCQGMSKRLELQRRDLENLRQVQMQFGQLQRFTAGLMEGMCNMSSEYAATKQHALQLEGVCKKVSLKVMLLNDAQSRLLESKKENVQLSEQVAKLHALESCLEVTKIELETSKEEAEEYQVEVEKLQQQLDEYKRTVTEAVECSEQATRILDEKAELFQLQSQQAKHAEEAARMQKEEFEAKAIQLEEQLAQLAEERKEFHGRLEVLRKEEALLRKQTSRFQLQKSTFEKQQQMGGEIQSMAGQLRIKEQAIEVLRKEYDSLQRRFQEQQRDLLSDKHAPKSSLEMGEEEKKEV